jgi:hypothetical protein
MQTRSKSKVNKTVMNTTNKNGPKSIKKSKIRKKRLKKNSMKRTKNESKISSRKSQPILKALKRQESFDSIESKRLRKRWKTLNEREVLECYFVLDPEWSRKTIKYLKDLVQLSEKKKQIYKWGYEKRRKLGIKTKVDVDKCARPITRIEDLQKRLGQEEDYNKIVKELFPVIPIEEEVLSDSQKQIYDKVKEELIKRNEIYENQTDLDKLLNDRIPIKEVATDVQRAISGTKKEWKRNTPSKKIENEDAPKASKCEMTSKSEIKNCSDYDMHKLMNFDTIQDNNHIFFGSEICCDQGYNKDYNKNPSQDEMQLMHHHENSYLLKMDGLEDDLSENTPFEAILCLDTSTPFATDVQLDDNCMFHSEIFSSSDQPANKIAGSCNNESLNNLCKELMTINEKLGMHE